MSDSSSSDEQPDCTDIFIAPHIFGTRREAENWVRVIGRENNMFFAITHSRENLVYMGCESAGAHRPTIPRNANAKGRNSSGSKKTILHVSGEAACEGTGPVENCYR